MTPANIYDTISISTNLLLVIPTLIAVTTRNRPAAALAVGVTATALIGEALKTKVFWTQKRPRGARDCDPLCQEGPCEHKPGMPSTHAAVTAFFTAYIAATTKNFYLTAAATTYLLLVLLARYKKCCHSVAQLAAGTALGFGLAALFFVAGF
jgi:membrane-associated phospholipid phosphatase